MATTTTRGWHYPDENENPYWLSFVEFAEDASLDVDALAAVIPGKIPYSLFNAAGDLLVGTGSATGARLPKGADTTILTMTAGAVGWAAPATQTPASGSITSAMLRDSAANSVIGRATNSSGVPADIATSTAGQVLRLSGTTLGFGAVDLDSTNAVTNTLGVANGGTNLASGTSGGVLGFTGGTTLASSAALTANALVLGGGAGATPTPLGSLGTTTTLLHGNAAGAPSFGAVSLTGDVTGVLPVANGGTGSSLGVRAVCLTPGTFLQSTTTGAILDRTYTMPAGAMNQVGYTLRVTMGGTCYTAGSPAPILDLAISLGGATIGTLRLQYPSMAASDRTVTYRGSVTVITTGTSGTYWCSESTAFGSGIHATPIQGATGVATVATTGTLNFTGTLVVGIWAKWDLALASNAVRVDTMLIEGIPATATFG